MADKMSAKHIKELLIPVFNKYESHVVFAYLFGSAAKDSQTPLSDIDIAVFLSDDRKKSFFDTKLSLHADFCRIIERNDIDVVVLNTATNIMLLEQIVNNGIVLFDTDIDLRKEFEQKVLHRSIDFKEQRMALMNT